MKLRPEQASSGRTDGRMHARRSTEPTFLTAMSSSLQTGHHDTFGAMILPPEKSKTNDPLACWGPRAHLSFLFIPMNVALDSIDYIVFNMSDTTVWPLNVIFAQNNVF